MQKKHNRHLIHTILIEYTNNFTQMHNTSKQKKIKKQTSLHLKHMK